MKIPDARVIVAKVLLDQNTRKFSADSVTLHRAFYELYKKNKEIMGSFDFIKRVNPYSPTLENLFQFFQMVGALSRANPDYVNYEINTGKMQEILHEEDTEFVINGSESIKGLFVKNCQV